MKTRLLRKLRNRAKKKYRIVVRENISCDVWCYEVQEYKRKCWLPASHKGVCFSLNLARKELEARRQEEFAYLVKSLIYNKRLKKAEREVKNL